jgi:protein-L-isoaspartate(D-aspartate) O-methyltransferase
MKRFFIVFLLTVLTWLHACSGFSSDEESFSRKRAALVQDIEGELDDISRRVVHRPVGRQVIQAMLKVPRHEFVPEGMRPRAYENRPLPIGHDQTISQPLIVGIMTDLLDLTPASVVLEVGTGSGYQAAVLAVCSKEVYTIEIIRELGEEARDKLGRLGYRNVEVRVGDGYHGWGEHAPFDAIMVTAAPGHIPAPLVEQLKAGGKMIIPVGPSFSTQYLTLVEKDKDGKVTTRQVLPVAFVPLTGGH